MPIRARNKAATSAEVMVAGPRRVLLLGATGTVGQATLRALLERGHHVRCLVRPKPAENGRRPTCFQSEEFAAAEFACADVSDVNSLKQDGFQGERFDALVSCLASRTGEPSDAWAIDYQAHVNALQVAKGSGVRHFVLLSAICVQKPRLAFQFAKLAFEKELTESGLTYSIVRPTALFKSLSGQIKRLRSGKSFLVFGDGKLTSCKPISDRDLGVYMADCLENTDLQNRILPIGGPGPAITPLQQGEALFELLGKTPRFTHVPVGFFNLIVGALTALGKISPAMARKSELARIGQYYATESMLLWNPASGSYDADATPSTGQGDIFQFYKNMIRSEETIDLGDHAVF